MPGVDAFRHVAEAYGDDNPLWSDDEVRVEATCWGGVIAPPPLVGGDSLIGVDEVTEVPEEHRELMRGDPLRGVARVLLGQRREWWAPLRPDQSVTRRNALVGVLDKSSEFAERAVHEWTAQVFREADGPVLSAQYRLMIRTERTKARATQEVRRRRAASLRATRRSPRSRRSTPRSSRRGAEPRWWEDVAVGDEVGPMVKGPLTVTDMVCWHVGMGMGLYGVKPLRLGYQNRTQDPPLLPPRRPQRARRDAAGALGPRVRPAEPATPPRSTTGACARRG